MSKRQDIVDKVVQKLQTANVTDATHFFKNPFREISPDELPAIKVAIMRETPTFENTGMEYSREADLVIAYVAEGNDKLADNLYTAAESIENFIINDENTTQLDGLLDDLKQSDFQMNLEVGRIGLGAAVLTFRITYWTKHAANFVDLEKIGVTIKPETAPASDPPLFEEIIDLPQS